MPSTAPGIWERSIKGGAVVHSRPLRQSPPTSYLLQSVPLTASAVPDPLEVTSPPWIEDIIFNLKGQAESYTPLCLLLQSPAPDPATLFSSAGALRSSYKVNIHGPSGLGPWSGGQFYKDPMQRNP